jgi:hypothetical protein
MWVLRVWVMSIWVPHFSRLLREVGILLSFIPERSTHFFLPVTDFVLRPS